ncbi:MAG TPA: hypothetical protein VFL13_05815 [Candidatus Baltobacteraceae bacterium]|nr:hypothetical protein [Candidatus Baltobacteraceae bacterium]
MIRALALTAAIFATFVATSAAGTTRRAPIVLPANDGVAHNLLLTHDTIVKSFERMNANLRITNVSLVRYGQAGHDLAWSYAVSPRRMVWKIVARFDRPFRRGITVWSSGIHIEIIDAQTGQWLGAFTDGNVLCQDSLHSGHRCRQP